MHVVQSVSSFVANFIWDLAKTHGRPITVSRFSNNKLAMNLLTKPGKHRTATIALYISSPIVSDIHLSFQRALAVPTVVYMSSCCYVACIGVKI